MQLFRIGLLFFFLVLPSASLAFQLDTIPFDWQEVSQQYQIKNYTTSDGLPVNSANYIVHHNDGFIYLATNDGLLRFDGDRFVVFETSTHPMMQSNRIKWISEGPAKELCFVDVLGNLYFLNGDHLTRLQDDPKLSDLYIHKVNSTENGALILQTNKGLMEKRTEQPINTLIAVNNNIELLNSFVLNGEQVDYLTSDGWFVLEDGELISQVLNADLLLPSDQIYNMIKSRDGSTWLLGYNSQLLKVDPQNVQHLYSIPGSGSINIWDAKEISDDELLLTTQIGYLRFNRATGEFSKTRFSKELVSYFEDNAWTQMGASNTYLFNNKLYINNTEVLAPQRAITFLTIDREGSIWVATSGDGVYRITKKKFITIGPETVPGLANVYGLDTIGDNLWVSSFQGSIYKFTPTQIERWSASNTDFDSRYFRSVLVDDSSNIYAGNFSLWKFNNKSWNKIKLSLDQNELIDVLYQDSQKRFWLGNNQNLYLYDGSAFNRYSDSNGLETGGVSEITELENGDLAISTFGMGVGILSTNNHFTFIDANHGLSSNMIRDVYQSASDTLWVATEDKGLNRIILSGDRKPEQILSLGKADGLIDHSLHKIIEDEFSFFWINSNSGIMRIKESDLNNYLDGRQSKLAVQHFSEKDGLLNIEGNGGTQNAGLLTDDGKLFFPNQSGIIYTRPDWFIQEKNTNLASPVFESISFLDSVKNIMRLSEIELSRKQRNVRVKFTLPTFAETHQLQLEYKLEGVNEHWQLANADRMAIFTNLPSGTNNLRVRGYQKGMDYSAEASLLIKIEPYHYETLWFALLSVAFLIGLFFSGFKILLIQAKYREKKLEQQVASRTNELLLEKEKTEEALQLIKKLDQSKSEFFTNFTHELRTPLSLILSPLEEMLESNAARVNGNQAPLSLMMRNANRLKDLVNQLLDVSKLNSGHLSLNFEEVNIAELTTRIISQFDHSIQQKNLAFNIEVSENIPLVYVDAHAWYHICTNILSNAIKFTPKTGTIRIKIQESDTHIQILFSDTGSGIAKNDLPFIFDPYYQSESPNSKGGTGIGLAIVKGMVEKLFGKISVLSEVDSGTEFIISLKKGGDHIPEDQIISSESKPEATLRLSRPQIAEDQYIELKQSLISESVPKVLIVEDNPDFRVYLHSLISRDYFVQTAENGREGLEMFHQFNPDIIVSDIMMPYMNGYEMMEEIRKIESFKHIPFIFLSAKDSDYDIQKGLNIGADIYLTKPVQNKLLLTQIKVLLRREKILNSQLTNKEVIENPLVTKTIEIIKRHLGNPELNVELIAESLAMSSATLYRNWKRENISTINTVITKLRLEEALKLITEEKLSISEAAYAVGYKHLSHFSRAFKKDYGSSPKKYLENKKIKASK